MLYAYQTQSDAVLILISELNQQKEGLKYKLKFLDSLVGTLTWLLFVSLSGHLNGCYCLSSCEV